MTSPRTLFEPATAGLLPGWSFINHPSSHIQFDTHYQSAIHTDMPLSLTLESSPPSSARVQLLASIPLPPQPLEIQWAAVPRRYPMKQNTPPRSENASSHAQPSLKQSPLPPSIMAATTEDILSKRNTRHQSHRRSLSADVVRQSHYYAATQFIPPPPPPQSPIASTTSFPTIPFDAQTRTGSPFRVYHVCQICHQPRSKSYHRRHPVHSGDTNTTPSVCHRCRSSRDTYEHVVVARTREKESVLTPRFEEVGSDDEIQNHANVSSVDQSSEWMPPSTNPSARSSTKGHHYPPSRQSHTKITTKCYTDNGESSIAPTSEQASTPLEAASASTLLFRHVVAPRHVDEIRIPESANATHIIEPLSPRSAVVAGGTTSILELCKSTGDSPAPLHSSNTSAMRTSVAPSKAHQGAQEEVRRSHTWTVPVFQTTAPSRSHNGEMTTPSVERDIAAEEVSRYSFHGPPIHTAVGSTSSKSTSITPSEVRRIARGEIESYRGAERAMQAHPNAYNHGYATACVKDAMTTATETISPGSSISQRPPRQQRDRSRVCEPSVQRSWETKIDHHQTKVNQTEKGDNTGDGLVYHFVVTEGSNQQQPNSTLKNKEDYRNSTAGHRPQSSNTEPFPEIHEPQSRTPRYEVMEDFSKRLGDSSERMPGRDDGVQQFRDRHTGYNRQYNASDQPHISGPTFEAHRPFNTAANASLGNTTISATPLRTDVPTNSRYMGKDAPVSDYSSHRRETHSPPPGILGRDSDDITVWPGHVPGISRDGKRPTDSLAMHRHRIGEQKKNLSAYHRRDESYIIPRGSIRRPPSPPREQDIIREGRRAYRERSLSRDRFVTERIVRVAHNSPNRRNRRFRSPSHQPIALEEPQHGRPLARPRSILRPPSTSPGDDQGFYGNARVTFASRDNVAPTPSPALSDTANGPFIRGMSRYRRPPRGHEFDGPNSNWSTSDDYFYERDRGRTPQRYGDVEEIEDYQPEMKQVFTRALSESPSRERAEDIKEKAKRKRVKVQVLSDAHGPFHAEVSPTASMEVLTNGSEVDISEQRDQHSRWYGGKRGQFTQKMAKSAETLQKVEPGWLRVTKVKQYISPDGKPYEEVEESIVLEDEVAGRSGVARGSRSLQAE